MTLTDKGVANYKEVIRLCFAQINKLKEPSTPPAYIHEEKKVMNNINFDF